MAKRILLFQANEQSTVRDANDPSLNQHSKPLDVWIFFMYIIAAQLKTLVFGDVQKAAGVQLAGISLFADTC